MRCPTCFRDKFHVHLQGSPLSGMNYRGLYDILQECGAVKPIHVVKKKNNDYAVLHLETKSDAGTFYRAHGLQRHLICFRLEDVQVHPVLHRNRPVSYASSRAIGTSPPFIRCSSSPPMETLFFSSPSLTPSLSPASLSSLPSINDMSF